VNSQQHSPQLPLQVRKNRRMRGRTSLAGSLSRAAPLIFEYRPSRVSSRALGTDNSERLNADCRALSRLRGPRPCSTALARRDIACTQGSAFRQIPIAPAFLFCDFGRFGSTVIAPDAAQSVRFVEKPLYFSLSVVCYSHCVYSPLSPSLSLTTEEKAGVIWDNSDFHELGGTYIGGTETKIPGNICVVADRLERSKQMPARAPAAVRAHNQVGSTMFMFTLADLTQNFRDALFFKSSSFPGFPHRPSRVRRAPGHWPGPTRPSADSPFTHHPSNRRIFPILRNRFPP